MLCAAIRLLCILAGALLLTGCGGKTPQPAEGAKALRHDVYIWQRQWTPAVSEAVQVARSRIGSFFVFAGELSLQEGQLHEELLSPDWKTLHAAGKTVVPVFRASTSLKQLLPARKTEVAAAIARMLENVRKGARSGRVSLEQLQLDYDCPTSRLGDYAELLRELKARLPELEISITALPSWMNSRNFQPLVEACDWFTLQIHGVERPRSIETRAVVCDYDRIPGWIAAAEKTGRPFRVALPTYSWRVVFDGEGKFVAFAGEQRVAPSPDRITRLAASNPHRLAEVVEAFDAGRPAGLRGVIWFRLPVGDDELNWSWPVLEKVMSGVKPAVDFQARVTEPQPSLYEVHLRNDGGERMPGEVEVPLSFRGRILARDGAGEYRLESDLVAGPIPRPGSSARIGWFRMRPDGDGVTSAVQAGKVKPLW